MEAVGSLSVTARVVIAIAIFFLGFAVLVGLTSLLTGLKRAFFGWLAALVAVVAALFFLPVDTGGIVSRPDPAQDYETAKARFDALDSDPAQPVSELCKPQLLDHGQKTQKVVVLMHGVSSCPRAFVDFAPLLHERGYNVLVVRMPENGYADRATDALADMTAEGLAQFADESVDIATGLGDEVVVVGISAGGTAAAFAAQNRQDVSRAVMLAPFFGLAGFGPTVNRALMRAMLILPSVSIWKDPILRDRYEGMPHAYQRQETRGIGEIMRLGFATYQEAREAAPKAGALVVVTNDADQAVSNSVTDAFVEAWRADGRDVTTYVFGAELGLGHELIDPLEPGADPALTYPVILDLIEGGDGKV